ncbi:MAG: hypothetical protein LBU05_06780, partial [Bifidobacteriaceae bacterium]|nr:hypothetical protein [Bifidobacteriaceae bacterium]
KRPADSVDALTYRATNDRLTVDDTGLITAPAYDDNAQPWDSAVQISSGDIIEAVTVHVINPYTWDWREDGWKIDDVYASVMVLDRSIASSMGFTLGIKASEGDLGNWDIYVYDGNGGQVAKDSWVGQINVTSIGEWSYSQLDFTERNVCWIIIRRPVSPDGSYNRYSISADLKLINYDGNVH